MRTGRGSVSPAAGRPRTAWDPAWDAAARCLSSPQVPPSAISAPHRTTSHFRCPAPTCSLSVNDPGRGWRAATARQSRQTAHLEELLAVVAVRAVPLASGQQCPGRAVVLVAGLFGWLRLV